MLTTTGTDWASSHGIQAYPLAPGPGGGMLGAGNTWSPGPNPTWGGGLGGHEPVMVPNGGGFSGYQPVLTAGGGAGPNPTWGGGLSGNEPAMMSGGNGIASLFQNTNVTGQGAGQSNGQVQQAPQTPQGQQGQQSPEWSSIINWLMGKLGMGGGTFMPQQQQQGFGLAQQGFGGLSSLSSLFNNSGGIYSR